MGKNALPPVRTNVFSRALGSRATHTLRRVHKIVRERCYAVVARSVRLDSASRRSKLSARSVNTSRVAFNLAGDTWDKVFETAASIAPTAIWLMRRPFDVR